MAGEVRWDARPIGFRDVGELVAKVNQAPDPVPEPVLAFWSRGGVRDDMVNEGILSFTPADLVSG